MHHFVDLCLAQPQNTLKALYTIIIRLIILICNRFLQPWIDNSLDVRTDLIRCVISAVVLHLPELFFKAEPNITSQRAIPCNTQDFRAFIVPGDRGAKIGNYKNVIVMIFFHGGGFIGGEALMNISSYERWVKKAKELHNLDMIVFPVEYRLLGEAKYPACLEDATAAYNYVQTNMKVPPERIIIAGDSAGGGLCTMLNHELKRLSTKMPAATILISPWLDLSLNETAYSPGQYTDFVAIIPGNRAVVYAFIPEHMSMTNPLVSPLYSDQAGLGPQLIFAADTEGLLNDSRAFHQKCIAANVQAKLVIGRGQMHTYALGGILTSKAVEQATDVEILAFIKKFAILS